MNPLQATLAALLLLPLPAFAQQAQTETQDALLDHMTGEWVLAGTIGGQPTTHDVTADWVLGHHYLRLHEVSREQDAAGHPAYEAIVFIGHDLASGDYRCLWLDSTSGAGLDAPSIGRGTADGNRIPLLFPGADGSTFHTTFSYDAASDTWQWQMDDERNGTLEPFARVVLTRAAAAAGGPEQVIRSLYANHVPGTKHLISFDNEAELSKYYDPDLTALFMKDSACRLHAQEHCALDFDPVYDVPDLMDAVQGYALRQLSGDPDVSYELTFADSSRRRLVYFLDRTPAGWRVRDVQYPDGPSLKTLLGRNNETKTPDKPRTRDRKR